MEDKTVEFTGEVLLIDIEGTTTSISFVKETLFPYITKNLETYLQTTFETDQTREDIDALRKLAGEDAEAGDSETPQILDGEKDCVIDATVENVKWQMSKDRKSTALKQLQGHMWEEAYRSGEVKGHLYPEVSECVKSWSEGGVKVCIYSSGSVAAQKLLFGYSQDGDLTEFLTAYFDTKIGMKRESGSYTNISNELDVKPDQVLFLTDIPEEAEAAIHSGMRSIILNRPGNAPLNDEQLTKYTTIDSFNQINVLTPQRAVKRSAEDGDADKINDTEETNPPGRENDDPTTGNGELEKPENGEPPVKRKADSADLKNNGVDC